MGISLRIIFGLLLVPLSVTASIVGNDFGTPVLIVSLLLLMVSTGGLIRRGLFLVFIWLLGTVVVRALLTTLIAPSGGTLSPDLSVLLLAFSLVLAFALAVGGVVLVIYAASDWVLNLSEFLGVTRAQAMRVVASSLFHLRFPYQIIEDGMTLQASAGHTMSKFGGPGILVVRPANAAVLYRGGDISRIVGPGVFLTELFEGVKQAVDLRPHWDEILNLEVATHEGAQFRISVRFRFRIESRELRVDNGAQQRRLSPAPAFQQPLPGQPQYDQGVVRRAVYEAGPDGWREATRQAVEAALHDVIGELRLPEVFGDPTKPDEIPDQTRRDIAETARHSAWQCATAWGVCVERIDIVGVDVPENVRKQAVTIYDAAREGVLIRSRSEADAHAIHNIETVKLGARKRELEDIWESVNRAVENLPTSEIGRFLDLMETLAAEMSRDRAVAFRYLQTLEAMSSNPDAKLILNAGGSHIVLDTD